MAAVTEDVKEISATAEFQNTINSCIGNYELTADLSGNVNVTVPANSDITLDLNGHSLKIHLNLSASGLTCRVECFILATTSRCLSMEGIISVGKKRELIICSHA